MMKVEGILRMRGSKTEMFAAEYFSQQDVLSFDRSEVVYLYGSVVRETAVVATVIRNDLYGYCDLPIHWEKETKQIVIDTEIGDDWVEHNPPIPPNKGFVAPNVLKDMSDLAVRHLSRTEVLTPVYLSVLHHPKLAILEEVDDCCIIQKQPSLFDYSATIAFCNGHLCRTFDTPHDEYGSVLRIKRGSYLRRNKKDRDGSIVLVDFSRIGQVEQIPLSSFDGDLSKQLTLKGTYANCSFLLSVAGRLYLPSEFSSFAEEDKLILTFDPNKYLYEHALDSMVCADQFVTKNGRGVQAAIPDLKNDPNSFLVVIHRPNLRIFTTKAEMPSREGRPFVHKPVSGVEQHQLIFPYAAAGLVFNRTTRSVVDYVQVTNDMQSYTSDSTRPNVWRKHVAYVKQLTSFEFLGFDNNLMLACAMMHDHLTQRTPARVLYPSFEMLDITFKG